MNGYKVEYSADVNQICIIPNYHIPCDDFIALMNMYIELGYKYWLPADERGGYIFAKEKAPDFSEAKSQ